MDNENIDLQINSLVGYQVTQVTIEPFSVQLLMDDTYLHIKGNWVLLNANGEVIDRFIPLEQRTEFDLWRIAGQMVKSVELINRPPYSLTIRLENDSQLSMLANSDGYEDWLLSSDKQGKLRCRGGTLTFSRV
jgi:hypothetical protein